MGTSIRVQMDDSQKILLKRYLGNNGQAQIRFTKLVAKEMNNYIPYKTGRLKDMMISMTATSITYSAPYAKKNYYNNAGNGIQGTKIGGLRGKYWDKRMWIDKGDSIVKLMADFIGGRTK